MALSIKNPETDRLAHQLAEVSGESVTEAVTTAIRDRLQAITPRTHRGTLLHDISQIQELVASLPDRDNRSPEDIIGYDGFGLPG
ncbi:MAG: type II toxin-antitoxin system VapB family antitoxin [Gemmatimonadaceae bacterium]